MPTASRPASCWRSCAAPCPSASARWSMRCTKASTTRSSTSPSARRTTPTRRATSTACARCARSASSRRRASMELASRQLRRLRGRQARAHQGRIRFRRQRAHQRAGAGRRGRTRGDAGDRRDGRQGRTAPAADPVSARAALLGPGRQSRGRWRQRSDRPEAAVPGLRRKHPRVRRRGRSPPDRAQAVRALRARRHRSAVRGGQCAAGAGRRAGQPALPGAIPRPPRGAGPAPARERRDRARAPRRRARRRRRGRRSRWRAQRSRDHQPGHRVARPAARSAAATTPARRRTGSPPPAAPARPRHRACSGRRNCSTP